MNSSYTQNADIARPSILEVHLKLAEKHIRNRKYDIRKGSNLTTAWQFPDWNAGHELRNNAIDKEMNNPSTTVNPCLTDKFTPILYP
jgi:hypothetical protein